MREGWAGVRARAVAWQSVGARAAVLSDSGCDAGAFLPLPLPPRPRLPSLRPSPAAEPPPPPPPPASSSCRPPPGPLTRPPAPGCRPSSAEQSPAWRLRSRTVRWEGGRGAAQGLGGREGGLLGGSGRAGPGRGGRGGPRRRRWSREAAERRGERWRGRRAGLPRFGDPGRPSGADGGRSVGVGVQRDRLLRPGRRPVAPGDPFGAESSLEAVAAELRGLWRTWCSLSTWWVASFRLQERRFDFFFFKAQRATLPGRELSLHSSL